MHYANDIRQNEWPVRAKRQPCHILKKSSLALRTSTLRTNIHPEEGEFRSSLLILKSHSMGRRVFNKRDNFVPSRPASLYPTACRLGFHPTGATPSTRNTNQLKEQWGLQIPLSYARSPSCVFIKLFSTHLDFFF